MSDDDLRNLKSDIKEIKEKLNSLEKSNTAISGNVPTVNEAIRGIVTSIGEVNTAIAKITVTPSPEAPKPASPSIPPKTTSRYIHDTLFASNIGSVLVSLVNFSNKNSDYLVDAFNSNKPLLVYALFFIVFRIKAYLDDNASFILKEQAATGGVSGTDKAGFVVFLISWLFYSVSGFFLFTQPPLSFLFLILALIVFNLWIAFCSIFYPNNKNKEGTSSNDKKSNHSVYFTTNLFYIIALLPLCPPAFENIFGFNLFTGAVNWYLSKCGIMGSLVILGIVFMVDVYKAKSLNNIYK
ncbi:MAG TPA: hypothetical protein PKN75_08620 [Bacteroidia bacterium]|nr:hypothetical protein [Bacteroidia bacterium]HNU33642.1 hypothetical protein [Bacteroidia bacterium]